MSASRKSAPRVFISYSWDDETHKAWVRDFAARLMGDGVNVTLDQWHAVPGDQLPEFMERVIKRSNFVLIICTPRYKHRADKRLGGVGYEGDIMTAEVFVNKSPRRQRKFIPILRAGPWERAAATWLKGKYRIQLDGDPYSEEGYQDLLATLLDARPKPPAVGPRPNTYRVKMLIEHLKSTFPIDRRHAADALRELGSEAKAAAPFLIPLLNDEDSDVQTSAVETIDAIGPQARAAIPALIGLLDNQDRDLRRTAALALYAICKGVDDAMCFYTATLNTHDTYIREIAIDGLGEVGPKAKASISSLIETLRDGHRDLLAPIAQALGKIGPEQGDVIPTLISTLQAGSSLVRKAAAEALGNFGPKSKPAIAILKTLSDDKVDNVRVAASNAINKIVASDLELESETMLDT